MRAAKEGGNLTAALTSRNREPIPHERGDTNRSRRRKTVDRAAKRLRFKKTPQRSPFSETGVDTSTLLRARLR